jgi:hypothetical protein
MKRGNKISLIAILVIFLVIITPIFLNENKIEECQTSEDCVPASCCHAESCVSKELAPNCNESFCSMVCSSPLDCGVGYCGCIDNKCGVIHNE